jgi:hypothetical protein
MASRLEQLTAELSALRYELEQIIREEPRIAELKTIADEKVQAESVEFSRTHPAPKEGVYAAQSEWSEYHKAWDSFNLRMNQLPERTELDSLNSKRKETVSKIQVVVAAAARELRRRAVREPEYRDVLTWFDRLAERNNLTPDVLDELTDLLREVSSRQTGEQKTATMSSLAGAPMRELSDAAEHLLAGKDAVNRTISAQYLGVTKRQIRRLVLGRNLETIGAGHHLKITTSSLRQYRGSPEPPGAPVRK